MAKNIFVRDYKLSQPKADSPLVKNTKIFMS